MLIVFVCSDKENISLQSLIGHNIQDFCHASDVAQMKKHYVEGWLLFCCCRIDYMKIIFLHKLLSIAR